MRAVVVRAVERVKGMADQIEFSSALMCGTRESPDIRNWAIGGDIRRVHLADREVYVRGNLNIWFPMKTALPPANGTQGPISWTVWGGFKPADQWAFAPLVECINDDYVPTGDLFAPNQIGANLLYYADAPLRGYQPKRGEQIAFVVTTGDTRRQNAQAPGLSAWRTNVVLVPFQPGDYAFTGQPQQPPATPPGTPNPPSVPPQDPNVASALLELTNTVNVLVDIVKALRDQPAPVYRGRLQANVRLIGPIDTQVVLRPESE